MVVEEDCLYATDWRLMRVVLHDFDSGQDVSLIADRVGGDSMSLRAPPQVISAVIAGFSCNRPHVLPFGVPSTHRVQRRCAAHRLKRLCHLASGASRCDFTTRPCWCAWHRAVQHVLIAPAASTQQMSHSLTIEPHLSAG